MKHYLLEGQHLVPFEGVSRGLIDEHHDFLRAGYELGLFLFSGLQLPPHGGFLIVRAETPDHLRRTLSAEPFVSSAIMRFSAMTEFDPVQHQPFLGGWFGGLPMSGIGEPPPDRPSGTAMRHFLLEGEHLVPFEQRAPELVQAHRAFLQRGYETGDFLFSGPTIPPKGGILAARAPSLARLQEMLAGEPYVRAKVMRFARTTEFDPVQHQPILASWFGGATS